MDDILKAVVWLAVLAVWGIWLAVYLVILCFWVLVVVIPAVVTKRPIRKPPRFLKKK